MKNIIARKCVNCGATKSIKDFVDGMFISTWCFECRNPRIAAYKGNARKRIERIVANGGKIRKKEWKALCEKYGNKCLCCGRTDVKLSLDHVVPVVLGGPNTIDNAQPLCRSCNSKKHTRVIDYR